MGTVGPWPVAGSHGLSAERKGTAARPCGAGGLLRPTVAVRTNNEMWRSDDRTPA